MYHQHCCLISCFFSRSFCCWWCSWFLRQRKTSHSFLLFFYSFFFTHRKFEQPICHSVTRPSPSQRFFLFPHICTHFTFCGLSSVSCIFFLLHHLSGPLLSEQRSQCNIRPQYASQRTDAHWPTSGLHLRGGPYRRTGEHSPADLSGTTHCKLRVILLQLLHVHHCSHLILSYAITQQFCVSYPLLINPVCRMWPTSWLWLGIRTWRWSISARRTSQPPRASGYPGYDVHIYIQVKGVDWRSNVQCETIVYL